MPRFSRKPGITGIHHIVIRGINKEDLFLDDRDHCRFLEILNKYKQKTDCRVLAYCIMSNHVHLLLRTGYETVGDTMRRILISYSHYFNKKYERTGHVFQNRFFSEPVDTDVYLINVLRYIHNNPVKAGIVQRAEEYRWSSFSCYLNPQIGVVDVEEIYSYFPDRNNLLSVLTGNEEEDENPVAEPGKNFTDSEVRILAEKISGCSTTGEFRDLSKKERARCIIALRKKGISIRQISRVTGLSKSLIGSIR